VCSRIGMCSRMCIVVFTDWYVLKECIIVLNDVHNCAQSSGMCWEKDVIDWALRVRYKLW
jgi:hypothetical protein